MSEYYIEGASGQQGLKLGLKVLLTTQNIVTPKLDPQVLERPIEDTTRSYVLALVHEVHELLDELNWKMWKPNKPINRERVLDEFADILAFLGVMEMILYHRLGITPDELAHAYRNKTKENQRRAVEYGKQTSLEV